MMNVNLVLVRWLIKLVEGDGCGVVWYSWRGVTWRDWGWVR